MSYQALYRIWRPQQFQDVVGQEHITKTLQNALLQEKVSHAYLFSGPRGTGKTSAAKIFAKAINCERAPVIEPCNECVACKGITDGSISDVLEIDAASNNGVDEIREIRDKVKYAPSVVQYKVYIIDEVHMLSIGAFNALLKTLEEPPKHVIFILATTEPHKIPLTIISRCQRFEFHQVSNRHMIGRLETVMERQDVTIQDEALQVIARAADGGMRDALSLLDQAISYSDDIVTVENVLAVTGSVSQGYLTKLAMKIASKEVTEALQIVDEMLEEGKDPLRLMEDFIYYYRDMLLYKTSSHLTDLLERVIVDDAFHSLSEEIRQEEIYETIHHLSKSQQEMKFTNHPRIFLEVVVVKLCQQHVTVSSAPVNEGFMQRIEQLEKELHTLKTQGVMPANSTPEAQQERRPAKVTKSTFRIPTGRIHEILKKATRKDLEGMKSVWGELLDKLRYANKVSYAALLSNSEPVAATSESYILAFKYEIHCKMATENPDIVQTLQNLLLELIGKRLEMVAVPSSEWGRIREEFLQHDTEDSDNKEEASTEEDLLISEALKLVGENLIEIKE
ncbi:DNA polymerase III subunit gamma/tau [Priestia taiwanensis]|uniref:DNA-directed DNA polymerase n=1 Tax=Priestia taiwanensis TaxID=1347902 RepID=A0A917AYN2_9BACI|nr:DNA polymerase III subunit gamma/tau [Priestia taiwanensis]MBM7365276.1 DNA polymerase-3 subunit gamma/tau [Priestia taiwanensis]GGE85907.1 DNA polymerase III subunit gamma/tau [Priestia taiwanensis]